jgi:Metallo-beta-lactamase superfamily
MIFSLDVRRAHKGDCLIVHYGTPDQPRLVLIDAGPADTYKPHLKPRLDQIKQQRNLADDDSLPVDLLMVSHIDDDHINGVLELTRELVDAQASGEKLPLKIRNFWHNTFDDIIGNNPGELVAAVTASFGAASLTGEPDEEGLDPAAARVLASVGQGFRLRDDVKNLNLRLNGKFGGKLVIATEDSKVIDMGDGLKFTVAGPMQPELTKLQRDHDAFLKAQEAEKKKKAALASFTDTSVPNLSSLVLLAEVEGKTILLTGDARGDKILQGMEMAGLLKADGESKMHINILKMPHHGSDRNMANIFLRRITADHYVMSGDGQHGNPERGTMKMLFEERGDEDYQIHLTYPIDEIDVEREKDWIEEQGKEKTRQKTKPATVVRPDWSPEDNSLTAFFEKHPEMLKKVRIAEEGKPHVIDLLDKLGF